MTSLALQHLHSGQASPDAWLAQARAFLPNAPHRAFALIDLAPQHGVSIQVARRLHHTLSGLHFACLGHGFSTRAPTSRRAQVTRRGDILVAGHHHWSVVQPSQASMRALPIPSTQPLVSRGETLWWGEGAGLHCGQRGDLLHAPVVLRSPSDHPIVGLLAPFEGRGIFVETRDDDHHDLWTWMAVSGELERMANLTLSLDSEATPWAHGLVCIEDGIQSNEVRFVHCDSQAWQAKTIHPSPTRAVTTTLEGDVVSLERDGVALRWSATRAKVIGAATLPDGFVMPRRVGAMVWLNDGPRVLISSHRRPCGLQVVDIAKGQVSLWDGFVAPPTLVHSRLAIIGDAEAWYWFDPQRGTLPEAWRLPLALARPEELDTFVPKREERDALEAWRQAPHNPCPVTPAIAGRVRLTRVSDVFGDPLV